MENDGPVISTILALFLKDQGCWVVLLMGVGWGGVGLVMPKGKNDGFHTKDKVENIEVKVHTQNTQQAESQLNNCLLTKEV